MPEGNNCPVSVCIATHKRPDGLDRLLASLVAQQGAPCFDVVVVDNDVARSGEAVAGRYKDRLKLQYLVEPVRGLARVRNRSVDAATGEFLAFIDDDEWACPEWLRAIFATAIARQADIIAGPVEIVFDDEVPDHIRSCSLFRRASVPDGKKVPWHATHTSNALVRRSALPDPASPFDTAFDLTGGEDVDLFSRMIGRGALAVGSAAAVVFEHRPRRRASLRWLLRRALRNGTDRVTLQWRGLSRGRRLMRGLRAAVSGMCEAWKGALDWPRDRLKATNHFLRMADKFGQFGGVLGMRVREYKVHP